MQLSYWEKQSFVPEADIAIIGCGIVGLTTAIYLKEKMPELKIIILERGILPNGATTRNAGFACFGSLSELVDDLKHRKPEEVFELVNKRWLGLQKLQQITAKEDIGFKLDGGYELFTNEDELLYKKCLENIDFVNEKIAQKSGLENSFILANEQIKAFNFNKVTNLIYNKNEGSLHTGKLAKALIKICINLGINIIYNTEVTEIEEANNSVKLHVKNDLKEIRAGKVLIAVNGFASKFLPNEDVQAARNQVIVTEKIAGLKLKGTFHHHKGFHYFREIDGRILLGGGRQTAFNEEFTDQLNLTENIQTHLEQFLNEIIFPHRKVKIEYRWSGILGLGNGKMPIVKQLSTNVFCAVRMGGMGIALGSLTGNEAADLIISQL